MSALASLACPGLVTAGPERENLLVAVAFISANLQYLESIPDTPVVKRRPQITKPSKTFILESPASPASVLSKLFRF